MEETPMIEITNLPVRHGDVPLRVARGHFATNHSHINYYIDVTMPKNRLSEAKAIAKELNVPVLCLRQLSRANEKRDDKRHPHSRITAITELVGKVAGRPEKEEPPYTVSKKTTQNERPRLTKRKSL